jgi:hypothetical protein
MCVAAQLREVQESELLRPIVEQLAHCPRSVIILDDIHFADAAVLDSLKPAFDEHMELRCRTGEMRDRAVSTSQGMCSAAASPSLCVLLFSLSLPPNAASQLFYVCVSTAIFIATSDLEDRQTLLMPTLSKKEAIATIRKLALDRWGAPNVAGHLPPASQQEIFSLSSPHYYPSRLPSSLPLQTAKRCVTACRFSSQTSFRSCASPLSITCTLCLRRFGTSNR